MCLFLFIRISRRKVMLLMHAIMPRPNHLHTKSWTFCRPSGDRGHQQDHPKILWGSKVPKSQSPKGPSPSQRLTSPSLARAIVVDFGTSENGDFARCKSVQKEEKTSLAWWLPRTWGTTVHVAGRSMKIQAAMCQLSQSPSGPIGSHRAPSPQEIQPVGSSATIHSLRRCTLDHLHVIRLYPGPTVVKTWSSPRLCPALHKMSI
jgi:hypothetical protein